MADVVLYLAIVLVVAVVLGAIPRMRAANEETLAALHRHQAAHHQHPAQSSAAQIHDEQRQGKQAPAQRAA